MILDDEIPYQKYTGRFNKLPIMSHLLGTLIKPQGHLSQEHLLKLPGTLIKPPGNTNHPGTLIKPPWNTY